MPNQLKRLLAISVAVLALVLYGAFVFDYTYNSAYKHGWEDSRGYYSKERKMPENMERIPLQSGTWL
jgi:hypothetical protein